MFEFVAVEMSARCLVSNVLIIRACPSDVLLNIPNSFAREGPSESKQVFNLVACL